MSFASGLGFAGNSFLDAYEKAKKAQQARLFNDLYARYLAEIGQQQQEQFQHEKQGWNDAPETSGPLVSAFGPIGRNAPQPAPMQSGNKDPSRLGIVPPPASGGMSVIPRTPAAFPSGGNPWGNGGLMPASFPALNASPQQPDPRQLFGWLNYLSSFGNRPGATGFGLG